MTPEEYRNLRKIIYGRGAAIVGGCCGTTPEFIGKLAEAAPKAVAEEYRGRKQEYPVDTDSYVWRS